MFVIHYKLSFRWNKKTIRKSLYVTHIQLRTCCKLTLVEHFKIDFDIQIKLEIYNLNVSCSISKSLKLTCN